MGEESPQRTGRGSGTASNEDGPGVELAAKAGISRGYLARLETARQDPTLTTLERLAKALGVEVSRLLD